LKSIKKNKIIGGEDTGQRIKKNGTAISIEKGKMKILEKLMVLEKRLDYLKPDFTQQTAKKIKTNTSYLSSVVNNHYNKSFSEYLNELRIKYVIDEVSNATYGNILPKP
jgi:YesN/AraC family two-component response regulator